MSFGFSYVGLIWLIMLFVPNLIWTNHMPTTRKLTCSQCGHKGFCVEIWGGDGK